jgi:hypothetical protein
MRWIEETHQYFECNKIERPRKSEDFLWTIKRPCIEMVEIVEDGQKRENKGQDIVMGEHGQKIKR